MTASPPRRSAGFTLIELMVTVAVLAVLASIAYPSYQSYVRRSQAQEAFGQLADYRVKLEQYYQDFRGYGNAGGTACANGTPAPSWNGFASGTHFSFSCALASGSDNQGYTLTATGIAGAARGNVYTLNHANAKATTRFKDQAVTGKACWLARGDEC